LLVELLFQKVEKFEKLKNLEVVAEKLQNKKDLKKKKKLLRSG
jgi:hypothetical protein